MTSIFFLASNFFYIRARKEKGPKAGPFFIFTKGENWALCILAVASVVTIYIFASGLASF